MEGVGDLGKGDYSGVIEKNTPLNGLQTEWEVGNRSINNTQLLLYSLAALGNIWISDSKEPTIMGKKEDPYQNYHHQQCRL